MARKARPLGDDVLRAVARERGTPVWVYDARVVRARFAELAGFDVVRYAQKANPHPDVLRTVRALGGRVDAVSAGEIDNALAAGFAPEEVVFTADLFDRAALERVGRLAVGVNVGSADMLGQLAAARPGAAVTLRINPGFGHGRDDKVTTGGPGSKHGIWHEDLPAAVARARELGLTVDGVHVHVGSDADLDALERTVDAVCTHALALGPDLRTISAGGGLPVPYRPGAERVDVARYTAAWRAAAERLGAALGRRPTLETEPGRYLVAESGVLLCEVRARKRAAGRDWILVDAGFHNLVRPVLYGAYHHLSVLGRDDEPCEPRLVAGPLCESADVFTQGPGGALDPRPLPDARIGDLLCIHDAGAYGAAMSSRYNSQPLAPEVWVRDPSESAR